jgi:hypothetical protein
MQEFQNTAAADRSDNRSARLMCGAGAEDWIHLRISITLYGLMYSSHPQSKGRDDQLGASDKILSRFDTDKD